MPDNFNLFLPLYKVEEQPDGTVMVYTRGTQSVPDAVGEIMDYETTVPEIKKWSENVFQRSGGKSYGNIRSMHNKIASGKLVAPINCIDSEQAVDLAIKVVDPVEAKKCLEGVYTGASMGGDYVKRWPDPSNPRLWRYTGKPNEFSLVDAPAVPTATFQMVKADGTTELRKFATTPTAEGQRKDDGTTNPDVEERMSTNPEPITVVQPMIPPPENVSGALSTVADSLIPPNPLTHGIELINPSMQGTPPVDIEKLREVFTQFASYADRFANAVEKAAAMREADEQKQKEAESLLKGLGSRVGIARRDGEPITPPSGYSANPSDYGDPANWSWPLDTAIRLQYAIAAFNSGVGKSKYPEREWHFLGRRIAQRTNQLPVKYHYSPKDTQLIKIEASKAMGNEIKKDALTSVAADLRSVAQSALDNINDPQKVMDALHQILAGIDVSSDAGAITPTTPTVDTGSTLQLAVQPVSTTTAPTTPTMDSTTTPETKAMMGKIDALAETLKTQQEMINKLLATKQPAPTPVQKGIPAGDLASLIQQPPAQQSPLEKAILTAAAQAKDGIEPAALQSIMDASNGNIGEAQNRAIGMVRKSLAERGFTSASKIRLLDPGTVAAIRAQSS